MDEKLKLLVERFKEKTKKDCYKIVLEEGEPLILDNKIGGNPYLPIGEEYPKDKTGNNMALLLQINLKDIELENYPKKGILEIFMDNSLGYPPEYEIKYFDEGLEYQTNLPNVDYSEFVVEKPIKISLKSTISYMSFEDYRFSSVINPILKELYDKEIEYYYQLNEIIGENWYEEFEKECNYDCLTIGGYPNFTQQDPREGIKENRDECLLKIDSCEDLKKFYIGDAGIIFVLISEEDIKNCNFQNAIVDWDCC